MKPNYENIELICNILVDFLEEKADSIYTEEQLDKLLVEVKKEYCKQRNVLSCGGKPAEFLKDAKERLIEWHMSYDEALQYVVIKYGYNPDTGKWDGSYKGDN